MTVVFKRAIVSSVVLLLSTCITSAQPAEALLQKMFAKMKSVTSYKADLKLNITVPFLKAPPSKATLWFKSPNKTHIEAPGFAMIPKQGADMSAATLLSEPYTSVDAGVEVFHGTRMRKITVIPSSAKSDIVVATIWVDTTLMVPRKVVSTAKNGGTFTAELVYKNAEALKFCLPSYVKLFFDVGNFELPKTMTGDFTSENDVTTSKKDKGKAIVEIWYSNYQINIPMSDEIFSD